MLQSWRLDPSLLVRVVLRLVRIVVLLVRRPILLGLWSWVVGVVSRMRLKMRGQRLELEDLLLEGLNHRVIADFFLDQLFVKYLVDCV